MRKRSKLLLGALVATIALGTLVSTTSARRFGLTNQSFRAVWTGGAAETGLEFVVGMTTIKCPATLEGSFHSRTLSKVAEALIGYVTRAAVGMCAGGTVTLQAGTLPWHIRYDSFSGTLPVITEVHVRILGALYLISAREVPFGLLLACKYEATAATPWRMSLDPEAHGPAIVQLRPLREAQINLFVRLAESVANCPNEHQFTNSSTQRFTLLGTATAISITLVA
jgi:hypothetical protein